MLTEFLLLSCLWMEPLKGSGYDLFNTFKLNLGGRHYYRTFRNKCFHFSLYAKMFVADCFDIYNCLMQNCTRNPFLEWPSWALVLSLLHLQWCDASVSTHFVEAIKKRKKRSQIKQFHLHKSWNPSNLTFAKQIRCFLTKFKEFKHFCTWKKKPTNYALNKVII